MFRTTIHRSPRAVYQLMASVSPNPLVEVAFPEMGEPPLDITAELTGQHWPPRRGGMLAVLDVPRQPSNRQLVILAFSGTPRSRPLLNTHDDLGSLIGIR